jgi:hypothetical protein
MRFWVPFLLGLSIFGFLYGCSSQENTVQKPTIQTTAPTYSKTPRQTITPTPHPTSTEEPIPTLEKRGNSILPVIISPINLFESQVVPIPTPENSPSQYGLRAWNESEGLAMVTALEEYAHNNDLYFLDARQHLPDDYKLVDLAINEFLYRFPESKYRDDLTWRLAMSKNLQGCYPINISHQKCSVMADWIFGSIEKYLNENVGESKDLNSFLFPRGFKVEEEYSIKNLFGDGRESKVYRIKPEDYYDPSLIFAVRQLGDRTKVQVIPIFIDTNNGRAIRRDSIAEIKDRNKNGVPEVITQETIWAGMSDYWLHIFEWDQNKFKDLSQGKIRSLYGDELMYEGVTWGDKALTIKNFGESDTYFWNGHEYELSGRENSYLAFGCAQYSEDFSKWANPQKAINSLDSVINNWSEEQSLDVGADCPNYLRLKKGLYYAQHDRPDLARGVFQDIVDHPLNLADSFSAEIAGVFLDSYKANEPLYFGCIKAQPMLDVKLKEKSESDNWVSVDYPPLCDLNNAYSKMNESLGPKISVDPIPFLQNTGKGIREYAKTDINDDGKLDWVIINTENNTIWALIADDRGIRPVLLGDAYHLDEIPPQSKLIVETIQEIKNDLSIILLGFGNDLYIYKLIHKDDVFEADLSMYKYNIQKYEVSQNDQELTIRILYTPIEYMEIYHWDNKTNEFLLFPLYGNEIFTENFPTDSLPNIEEILLHLDEGKLGSDPIKAQFLYLAGLIYELTGENKKAVLNYWEIWHDFPNSAYAVMACSKLDGCKP